MRASIRIRELLTDEAIFGLFDNGGAVRPLEKGAHRVVILVEEPVSFGDPTPRIASSGGSQGLDRTAHGRAVWRTTR
jgi:hypothetical protein